MERAPGAGAVEEAPRAGAGPTRVGRRSETGLRQRSLICGNCDARQKVNVIATAVTKASKFQRRRTGSNNEDGTPGLNRIEHEDRTGSNGVEQDSEGFRKPLEKNQEEPLYNRK